MRTSVVILGLAVLGAFALPAAADVRELTRSELRENVRLGNSMSLSDLLATVGRRFEGEVVGVRAFEAGPVFYRVLVKKPNGKLSAIVIDARTGQVMSSTSSAVRDVMAAAKSKMRSGNNSNRGGNGSSRGNRGGNGGGGGGGNGGGGGKK